MANSTPSLAPTRRQLLTRAAVVSAGAVVARAGFGGGGAGADIAVPPATPGSTALGTLGGPAPGAFHLFADSSLDYQARYAIGASAYGAGSFGEVVSLANSVNAAGASNAAYYEAMRVLASTAAGTARDAERAGDDVSAFGAYLRSSSYAAQALFYVLASAHPEDEPTVYRESRKAFDAAMRLAPMRVQRLSVRGPGGPYPAYLLSPPGAEKARPTVIVNNGSDGQLVDTWSWGGAAAVQRGWNALLFEGPGQGSRLFEHEVPFRPDWEQVITPVVDALVHRSDVDRKRIALTGWSMGGELVARAAAFEHRLSAVVTDPGCVDVYRAFNPAMRGVADDGPPAQVNQIWQQDAVPTIDASTQFYLRKRQEVFGRPFLEQARRGEVLTDLAGFVAIVKRFANAEVVGRIKCPTLVVNYEAEQFYPGQAEELAAKLRVRHDLVTLGAAQGAEYHCAPMAPQVRNEVVYDWLADVWR